MVACGALGATVTLKAFTEPTSDPISLLKMTNDTWARVTRSVPVPLPVPLPVCLFACARMRMRACMPACLHSCTSMCFRELHAQVSTPFKMGACFLIGRSNQT